MSKFYKQISTCSMCKARFVFIKGENYSSSRYCEKCQAKYFPKTETAAAVAEKT